MDAHEGGFGGMVAEATGYKSEFYLSVGLELVHALQNISRVDCGFAAIADVRTHRLDDRMDSYFIAETLKYLFLIFDKSLDAADQTSLFCRAARGDDATTDHREHYRSSPCLPTERALWTTEGHIAILPGGPFDLGLKTDSCKPNKTLAVSR